MSAQLKAKGYEVRLMDIRKDHIEALKKLDTFHVTGKMECEAKPDMITTDLYEAIDGVDVIMIATTTDAHTPIAKQIADKVTKDTIVVLTPGHILGAMNFTSALKEAGCKELPLIGECSDLTYACRTVEPGHILHTGLKASVKLGTIPAANAQKILDVIGDAFPMLVPAKNVLESGLNGMNALLHPIPSVMNINKVDLNQPFDYYIEGITPSICNIISAADKEIAEVYKVMRVENKTLLPMLQSMYHLTEDNIYDAIQNCKPYYGLKPPTGLKHRFYQEDMLCTLVPLVSIGKEFGVSMPVLESFIHIEGAMTGQDFFKDGRTVESLGLKGKTVEEIYEMIK